jgi:hypothetical protein
MMEKETQNEKLNSTEISINAKGQYSGKIKVYAETIEESWTKATKYGEDLEKLIKLKNG